jgi:long-chain acyl-CoA synthetase
VERIWLKSYPKGVPADVNVDAYRSVPHLFEENINKYRNRPAYICMGKTITFDDVDRLSRGFGAWLQAKGLAKGTRVAVMMPNVLQYPVAVFGILRAGLTVVNVNPLYTPRELEHQLKDSGAEAIVILENFATTLEQVLPRTPVKHIVVASMGDLLGGLKGVIVNFVVRNVKKMVPCVQPARRRAVQHSARRGRFAAVEAVGRRPRRRRVPPVHRRHDGRLEGRDAPAPQRAREHGAGVGLVRPGARRERPARHGRAAAAVSHLCADL